MNQFNTSAIKVVIVDADPDVVKELKTLIKSGQYQLVGQAKDGFDALQICKETHPQLVLMDIDLPFLDGVSVAQVLLQEQIADTVIFVTSNTQQKYIDKAKEIGVAGYIMKPIVLQSLIPIIEIAVARNLEFQAIKKEKQELEQKLENRKLIEKAKGFVMQQNDMTEQQAYEFIRNLSLKKNISMRRVAEMIIIKNSVHC